MLVKRFSILVVIFLCCADFCFCADVVYHETFSSNNANWLVLQESIFPQPSFTPAEHFPSQGVDSSGAIGLVFPAQSFPFPESMGLYAFPEASFGLFSGDYSRHDPNLKLILAFDLMCESRLPSSLIFRINSASVGYFTSLSAKLNETNNWIRVLVPLYNPDVFAGASTAYWETALKNISSLSLSITRAGIEQQRYLISNVTLLRTETLFAFTATALTNNVMLRWNNPENIGMQTPIVQLCFNTEMYPNSATNGYMIYEGTNQMYHHTDLTPNQTYYYSIFGTHDGVHYLSIE